MVIINGDLLIGNPLMIHVRVDRIDSMPNQRLSLQTDVLLNDYYHHGVMSTEVLHIDERHHFPTAGVILLIKKVILQGIALVNGTWRKMD